MKDVHFNCPKELYEAFLEIFPYKGEPTAFFNRCIEAAIQVRVPHEVVKQIDEIIKQVKEDKGRKT